MLCWTSAHCRLLYTAALGWCWSTEERQLQTCNGHASGEDDGSVDLSASACIKDCSASSCTFSARSLNVSTASVIPRIKITCRVAAPQEAFASPTQSPGLGCPCLIINARKCVTGYKVNMHKKHPILCWLTDTPQHSHKHTHTAVDWRLGTLACANPLLMGMSAPAGGTRPP